MESIGSERKQRARSFANYFTTTLTLGLLAGVCGVWPRGDRWVIIAPILLFIPGVVRGSLSLAGVGLLMGFILAPLYASVVFRYAMADTRDLVPLALYATPGVTVMNPGFGPLPWQIGAFVGLFAYLFPVDILMVVLRGLPRARLRRAACAILASDLVVLVLYPLSWGARTVRFYPEPASAIPFELFSLAVLMLVFPAKYLVLNYVYDPEGFWAGREPDWLR
jgi:hypothetical protein